MDFAGEFFWVLMLILYLVFQVIGARKKNRQIEEKRRKSSEPPEPVGTPRRREPELDEALQEIRRALGFPDAPREAPKPLPTPQEETQTTPAPAPSEVEARTPTVEPHRQPKSTPAPPTRPPVSRPQPRPEPVRVPPKPARIPPPRREQRVKQPSARKESGGGIYSSEEKEAFRNKYGLDEIDKPLPTADRESSRKVSSPPAAETTASYVMDRLKKASSAREAFLLKEVLDRPRAMRQRGRR